MPHIRMSWWVCAGSGLISIFMSSSNIGKFVEQKNGLEFHQKSIDAIWGWGSLPMSYNNAGPCSIFKGMHSTTNTTYACMNPHVGSTPHHKNLILYCKVLTRVHFADNFFCQYDDLRYQFTWVGMWPRIIAFSRKWQTCGMPSFALSTVRPPCCHWPVLMLSSLFMLSSYLVLSECARYSSWPWPSPW